MYVITVCLFRHKMKTSDVMKLLIAIEKAVFIYLKNSTYIKPDFLYDSHTFKIFTYNAMYVIYLIITDFSVIFVGAVMYSFANK